ncbi:MAG TPA: hypothetical protein VF265_09120 [Nevskiaceae bacterium]
MARKDPPPDHVGRIAVGVILAVVGFGTGAAALFVGRAPGVFTASAMSLMLIAAGAALFLWGLASILGHPPRTWRCPYCGFRRELR